MPPRVEIEQDLLRKVENLKYADHDVTDLAKFLDFLKENYMAPNSQLGGGVVYEK